MCDIYADECFKYLCEAQYYIDQIKPIDEYAMIFEAKDVENQIISNDENASNAGGALSKAAQSLSTFISNTVKSIIGFFERLFASKEAKADFDAIKAKIQSNPNLANKKVTFYDYKHNIEKLNELERAADDADKKLASGIDVDISGLLGEIGGFGKTAGKGIAGTVGLQVALNSCYGSKDVAIKLANKMQEDGKLMSQLTNAVGEKEAKKFQKEVNSLAKDNKVLSLFGKRVNLKRALNKARAQQCDSLEGAINYTLRDVKKTALGVADNIEMTKNNDLLTSQNDIRHPFRTIGNNMKAKGRSTAQKVRWGDMYTDMSDSGEMRRRLVGAHMDKMKTDETYNKGIGKFTGIMSKRSQKNRERLQSNYDRRVDYDDTVRDYNTRFSRGDNSAQSALSFITGNDRKRQDEINSRAGSSRQKQIKKQLYKR